MATASLLEADQFLAAVSFKSRMPPAEHYDTANKKESNYEKDF